MIHLCETLIDDIEINRIINVVVKSTGITFDQLKSDSRKRHIVVARHTAMYLLKLAGLSTYKGIGVLFGRDHSTVIYAVEIVEQTLLLEKTYRDNLNYLINQINPKLIYNVGTISKVLKD